MNLYDGILASLPRTSFKLNAAGTSFTDLTNRGVALTGTQVFANAIVSGNAKSLLIKNTNVLNFASTVFIRGNEHQPFSLEAVYLPMFFSGTQSIMSHTGAYDGLYFDGDKIHFKVEFNTTGSVDVAWPVPDFPDATHLVAVYNVTSILLYANSELVGQADISEAQQLDGFKTRASNNLYIGESANASQLAAIDGISTYHRSLTDAEIYRHFQMARRAVPALDIAGVYNATSFDGTSRDVYSYKEWSGQSWQDGIFTDVEFQGGSITPTEDPVTLISNLGSWVGVYEAGGSPVNLYGVKVNWDGDGTYVVETSINEGSTWQAAVNDRTVAGTFNWNPADKTVLVRVRFTGNSVDDASEIRRLRVTGYTSNTLYASDSSRTITLTGISSATDDYTNEPIENNSGAGLEIYGSPATINPDTTSDPRSVAALEVWVRFSGPINGNYVFDARSGNTAYLWQSGSSVLGWAGASAVYINGVNTTVNTFGLNTGQWYHIIFVFTTPMNTVINLPSTGIKNFSIVNLYPTAPTAAQALAIYKAYNGYPEAAIGTEDINVQEPVTPFRMYAYDWSIAGQ